MKQILEGNAMRITTHETKGGFGNSAFVCMQAWGDISWLAMQRCADVQYAYAVTQLENVFDQLQALGKIRTVSQLVTAGPVISGINDTGALATARKAAALTTTADVKKTGRSARRAKNVPSTKTKTAASRRRTRK